MSLITELLLRRFEEQRQLSAAMDEERARQTLGYVHRGEPLASLRLDRPEKAIRPYETLERWMERIRREDAA